MQQPPVQIPKIPALKILTQGLILPFKVLRFGNIWLIVYVLGLCLCGGFFLWFTDTQIQIRLTELQKDFRFSAAAHQAFSFTTHVICSFFVLPFIFTAIAVPARGVWAPQLFSLTYVFKDTFVTLRDSLRVLFFTARLLLPRIFPALALIGLYFFMSGNEKAGNARSILGLAALVVSCVQGYRCLPLFFLPFVTLASRAHPVPVLGWVRSILRGYLLPLGVLSLLACATITGTIYLMFQLKSSLPYALPLTLALIFCWIWYFLNALMLVSLKATIDHAQALEAARMQKASAR